MIGAAAARFDPEVEAALLARYGVDPLDPSVSMRRVWVLLERCPGDYLRDPMDWDVQEHLMASVLDSVNALLYVTVKVNTRKGAPVPRIPPIRRPSDTPKKPVTLADLATLLSKEGVVTT